jgi:hypothetical protein
MLNLVTASYFPEASHLQMNQQKRNQTGKTGKPALLISCLVFSMAEVNMPLSLSLVG